MLEKTDHSLIFLIGKRERELLTAILRRYPVMIAAHYGNRVHGANSEPLKNQELLQEALAEQQKENRRQLEELLAQSGRFSEDELGFRFHLAPGELEWVLQILNDVRVGSWVQLGEPDGDSPLLDANITEQSVQLAWTMEMAGLFEHELLKALSS